MKTLLMLVLSMASVAREATAQDAQCDRERAAMVETIRAYAGVLGQQGRSAHPSRPTTGRGEVTLIRSDFDHGWEWRTGQNKNANAYTIEISI